MIVSDRSNHKKTLVCKNMENTSSSWMNKHFFIYSYLLLLSQSAIPLPALTVPALFYPLSLSSALTSPTPDPIYNSKRYLDSWVLYFNIKVLNKVWFVDLYRYNNCKRNEKKLCIEISSESQNQLELLALLSWSTILLSFSALK